MKAQDYDNITSELRYEYGVFELIKVPDWCNTNDYVPPNCPTLKKGDLVLGGNGVDVLTTRGHLGIGASFLKFKEKVLLKESEITTYVNKINGVV